MFNPSDKLLVTIHRIKRECHITARYLKLVHTAQHVQYNQAVVNKPSTKEFTDEVS